MFPVKPYVNVRKNMRPCAMPIIEVLQNDAFSS